MNSDPLSDISYSDDLKAISFVSDTQEKAVKAANDWINGPTRDQGLLIAGLTGSKTGKNIFVVTVIYSKA